MAPRGRVPKPSALKILEGNPGKRPLNNREPKPARKAPPCPKWLEPEAKKEWRRLASKLEQLGILTEADMSVFASYCQAYARWKAAEEIISSHGFVSKTPSGYLQTIPHVSVAKEYARIMNRCAEQLGLTPASRSRLVAGDIGSTGATEVDDMEALLRGH